MAPATRAASRLPLLMRSAPEAQRTAVYSGGEQAIGQSSQGAVPTDVEQAIGQWSGQSRLCSTRWRVSRVVDKVLGIDNSRPKHLHAPETTSLSHDSPNTPPFIETLSLHRLA